MSRGKNCPGTIFASQLPRNYPHRRGNFERGKNALSCGGETVWEAFLETIWARAIASQKLSRDSGETIFAPRHQDVSQGPLGPFSTREPQALKLTARQRYIEISNPKTIDCGTGASNQTLRLNPNLLASRLAHRPHA